MNIFELDWKLEHLERTQIVFSSVHGFLAFCVVFAPRKVSRSGSINIHGSLSSLRFIKN